MIKVFVDPGHGGSDTGAVGNGIVEKNINLSVAKELRVLLEINGIDVKMSRESDKYVSLRDRADMANDWEADYFVSVHHNAGGGDGYEVIHSIHGGKGEELARVIGWEFSATGQNLRRIFSKESTKNPGTDFYSVIRNTEMAAVITEYAFLDTKDVEAVDTPQELEMEARAIAKGILNHLGMEFNDKQPEGEILIRVDGEIINNTFDVKPFIKDGRVMVPVRYIAEALGKEVKWIDEQNMVDIT